MSDRPSVIVNGTELDADQVFIVTRAVDLLESEMCSTHTQLLLGADVAFGFQQKLYSVRRLLLAATAPKE